MSSAEQPGIQSFLFDETTGELTAVGSFTGINSPSFLIVHPNETLALCGQRNRKGQSWRFRRGVGISI